MSKDLKKWVLSGVVTAFGVIAAGCGAQPVVNVSNANSGRTNGNATNSNLSASNANSGASTSTGGPSDVNEPGQYMATVTVKVESTGGQQTVALPTLSATVARSGDDRRMEFTAPAGGHIVYLDKAGASYVIFPDKKQYADVNKETTGFDVRRLLMPEQIVQQVKDLKGVERVGDEQYQGRDVVRYRYAAVANTGTQAGQVQTDSFLLVDKATGLPLHSEAVSQASGSVQGYNGLRVVTDITDIKTDVPTDLFNPPTNYAKIDSQQVRAQVDQVFSALASIVGQLIQKAQTGRTGDVTGRVTREVIMGKFLIGLVIGLAAGAAAIFFTLVGVPRASVVPGSPIAPPDSTTSAHAAEVVLSQDFFNQVLGTIFHDMNAPAFKMASTSRPEAGQPEFASFMESGGACDGDIRVLEQGSGVKTAISFDNDRITAPMAFAGSFNSPVGCVNFTGWADTHLELRYDDAQKTVFGQAVVDTVDLDGVNPLVSGIVTPFVQSTLNSRVNPIQIINGRQLAIDLPIASAGGDLRADVNDIRAEVKGGALDLYVTFGFSGTKSQ